MKRYLNKMTTSNGLKFKLVSGTHGLRSQLSRRDIKKALFRKEWFDGDETHRCVMLLRSYGAFVTKPFMLIEMA
eukprot:Awhi_evm1s3526